MKKNGTGETLVGARVQLRDGTVGVVVQKRGGNYDLLSKGRSIRFYAVDVLKVGNDVQHRTSKLQKLLGFEYVAMQQLAPVSTAV